MAEKDMIEKTLEGYNDVFADIVNGLLFGGEPLIDEKSLVDAAPASMYKIDGDVHEEERDVAKYWVNQGEKVNVRISLLGMENQTKYDPDMPLRVMGYDGAAYRAELSGKERYPVVTLVLNFSSRRWGKAKSLYDCLHIPKELRPYVKNRLRHPLPQQTLQRIPDQLITMYITAPIRTTARRIRKDSGTQMNC